MTHSTKPAPRRGAASLASAMTALVLAGCSTGHIGESWQCPLAEGGSCDSVAAADPAVPEAGASGSTVLRDPLWRMRSEGRSGMLPARGPGQAAATPCEAECGEGFDPFAWLARLFGAQASEGEAGSPGGSARPPSATAAQPPEARPGDDAAARTAARTADPAAAGLPAVPGPVQDDPAGDDADGDPPGADLRTVGEERETVALMRGGQARGRAPMRGWQVQGHLNRGPLTAGQKDAVKLILSAKDRTVGVQGYAGTGKTTMLNRARTLAEKKGWRMAGLAPSASAVQTLASEAGIESETLQRFLARNAGVAEGRLTRKGAREMRATFSKTILVVDEGSLASTVQARDLLRIANALRIPRVVLVGDAKQLDAVDAGKPFAQLQAAGMQTATMDEIMRQRDPALKEAVEASFKGDIERAFEKLGRNVAEVKPDNIGGAVAARWLRLDADARANTGVMAPSHELRQAINGHIRERLSREGRLHGPAMESERLVSMGYTNART